MQPYKIVKRYDTTLGKTKMERIAEEINRGITDGINFYRCISLFY